MAEESEKRFHAVMDKLFHAPPKSKSISLCGAQLPRAKKRSNMVEEFKFGSVEAPVCRPWDRGDLLKRLATFKSMTWFAKPQVVSAVNCARRGWVNVDSDIIACEACGARLLFSSPSSWTHHQVEKAALVFSLKLNNGHKLLCPWVDNACDERLAQFPPMPSAVLVDNYKKRCSVLLQLSALPVISSSAIDYMRSPQLEHFLEGSSTIEFGIKSTGASTPEYPENELEARSLVLYHQAQRIISLCGWEPRSLPYVVNYRDLSDRDTDLSVPLDVISSATDDNTEANDDPMTTGVQYDPSAVVLDCRICGASIGLWAFSTVSQPAEFVRLVGFSEVNGENAAAPHKECTDTGSHAECRERSMSTGTTGTTSLNEMPLKLNLTIAGGPPPAKQNFRPTISLPVIGRNLRARFSSDSEFSNYQGVRRSLQGDKDHNEITLTGQECLEGAHTNEQEIPETSTPDSSMKNLLENMSVEFEKLPENAESVGTADPAVGDLCISRVVDGSVMNSDYHVSIGNEASVSDTQLIDVPDNCSLQQNRGTDIVCSKHSDTDGQGVDRVQFVNNNIMTVNIGKDIKQPQLGKAMEFDPIRQHRHFCPWIASSGNSAPGWQQTLFALQRQQESSFPPSTNAPSSSIIQVDDPVGSVKKLFMSPSAKRKKFAHG